MNVRMVLFIINWTMTGSPTGSRMGDNQHKVGSHVGFNERTLPSSHQMFRITLLTLRMCLEFFVKFIQEVLKTVCSYVA